MVDYKFFIFCILLVITATLGTLGTKIDQVFYSYDQYWVIIFYTNIFFVINVLVYLKYYTFKQLMILFKDKKLLKKFSLPAMIYTGETAMLYWCLINVPISVYIIGRTSNAFFNVPFSKYYLKKKVPKLYYLGLLILIGSYVLLILNFADFSDGGGKTLFAIIFLFLSGGTTATYNNMVEKHLSEYSAERHFIVQNDESSVRNNYHTKFEIQLFYQIIVNMYGFIIMFPIAIGFCGYNKLFDPKFVPNLLFVIVGLSYQIYFLFKIFILSYKELAGNQILSALDLLRRVITNTFAYALLNEYFNKEIIGANVCMFIGSLLFILGQINFGKKKIDPHEEPILLENINNNDDGSICSIETNN